MAGDEQPPPARVSHASRDSFDGLFVGRGPELRVLQQGLADARAGSGSLVAISGEAGAGKTQLVRRLTLGADGCTILSGRCLEGQATPPYWVWHDALREIAAPPAQPSPDRHTIELLDDAAALRVAEHTIQVLLQAAQRTPVVLVLEDLHLADRPSLLTLELCAERCADAGILMLLTHRLDRGGPQGLLAETLGVLYRQPHLTRIELAGLDTSAVTRMLAAAAGGLPPTGFVADVISRTGGNCLFVAEVARALAAAAVAPGNAVPEDLWTAQLPAAVRVAVSRRFNLLPEATRDALTVAAYVGRDFELDLLTDLIDLDPAAAQVALDAAVAASFLEVPTGARYRFAHEVVRESIASVPLPSRRALLHQRVGEAIERRYAHELPRHAADLARHFAGATSPTSAIKAARYAQLAGDTALAANAYAEAIDHYLAGLVAGGGAGHADGDRVPFWSGIAYAAASMGDIALAREHLVRVCGVLLDQNAPMQAARYLARLYIPRALNHGPLCLQILQLIDADCTEARMLRCQAVAAGARGEGDAAEQELESVLAEARARDDHIAEMRAVAELALLQVPHARFRRLVQLADQAIPLAERARDSFTLCHLRQWRGFQLLTWGRSQEAGIELAALSRQAHQLRSPLRLGGAYHLGGAFHLCHGSWEQARSAMEAALALTPADPFSLNGMARIAAELGERELAARHLQQLHASSDSATGAVCFVLAIVLSVAAGAEGQWLEAAERVLARLATGKQREIDRLGSVAGGGMLAALRGDTQSAGRARAELIERSTEPLIHPWGCLSLQRVAGRLSTLLCDWDTAADHFRASERLCRAGGYIPELAWTRYDTGRSCGAQGLAKAARDHYIAALRHARSASMVALAGLCEAELEASAGPETTPPAALSPRERQVLARIVAGDTNQEIAYALEISERTVEKHVGSILRKTGARSRTEAAVTASRAGLL